MGTLPVTAAAGPPIQWVDWVPAVAAAVQGVVVLVAVAIAASQLGEVRRARRDRERPFVVVEFDAFRRLPFIYLTVKNHGATIARNVRMTFEPPLKSSIDDKQSDIGHLGFVDDGIPTLAPGRQIETLFDSFIQRRPENLPERYSVHLTYTGPDGREWPDHLELDLGVFRRLMYIDEKGLSAVVTELEQIRKDVHRWTDWGGLHVRTDADLRRDADQRRQEREEMRRELERGDGAPGEPGPD